MEDSFGTVFVYCIIFNFVCWIIYFIWSFIKKKFIKHEKISLSCGEILFWGLLAVISSIFGLLTTTVVGFFVFCVLIGNAVRYFVDHWLDDIVEFLYKGITF